MAVVTTGTYVRIVQVGIVEARSPGNTLGLRHVSAVVPEPRVTLGATALVICGVRVELVRVRLWCPAGQGYNYGKQHK